MIKFKGLVAGALMAATAMSAGAATFIGDRTDFRDETIYFAMTTRFYDGDPTNNVCSWDKQNVQKSKNDPDWRGDFKGLIDKLDYIKALGFTAIWITPIVQNASGEDYHGYHAMDFTSVDLRYESRKEWGASEDVKFETLIKKAHEKGLKIVLDVVLQHTGNFGEVNLNPLFKRDQNIRNQANVAASLIPNTDRLSSNYFDQDGESQYKERWKYFKNPEYEPNNYYHHYGTGWNWDLSNRWWGQIAGDCVDLNTENNHVAEYIVNCYGDFIRMGVDAFRIDTSGHISPLTFNKQFIPQLHAIAEEAKGERLNQCPFFMFGEVCQRFQGSVVYRDQPNLSSYFYTWKSDQSLLDQFNGDPEWWAAQVLPEGHDTPVGPMAICEQDTQDKPRSNNAWLLNHRWHEPDYSRSSGFNIIDFPMHYSFNSVGTCIGITSMDNYYNDATYNVVYVDSHDYCPGPNDGTRFNGGTEQWAENMSFMFTFRGIPCIYYGSEVEFKKGLPIDVGGENNQTPRSESGRAYFGTYLEGSVEASDFGEYSASGNVAQTLNADLAQHVRRLNQIRAAVPALRKGQYTREGCTADGGWAYLRGYRDSYACVAVNGGGTFTNLPAGTYTEIVTGQKFNVAEGGSLTLTAPKNKGQLRVAVRNFTGPDIVGEDGKFIYKTSPVAHGGSVEFEDPGTTSYYTAEDALGRPAVTFNPNGGAFKTETLTVTASLNETATSGSIQINGGAKLNLNAGESKQFTVGDGMSFGQTAKVTWTATDGTDTYTGTVSYKKVDPNAVTNIFVTGKDGADISGTHIHAWTATEALTGAWPGPELKEKVTVDGREFYTYTCDTSEPVNIIFNRNGAQTGNIEGLEGNVYFEYDGVTSASKIDVNEGPQAPTVKANPASGQTFTESLTVTLTASPATDIFYTLNGQPANGSCTKYTAPITLTETTTINTYVKNDAGEKRQSFTYTKVDAPEPGQGTTVYVTGKNGANISGTYLHAWTSTGDLNGGWPGKEFTETKVVNGKTFYYIAYPDVEEMNIIFHRNNGKQTADIENVSGDAYFEYDGEVTATKLDIVVDQQAPVVTANPASGYTFSDGFDLKLSVSPATDIFYTLDGTQANGSSTKYTGPILITETTTVNTYVKNEVGERRQSFTYTRHDVGDVTKHVVYFLNSGDWGSVHAYCWDDNNQEANAFSGPWPGTYLTETVTVNNVHPDINGIPLYKFTFEFDGELSNPKVIFNAVARTRDNAPQTADYKFKTTGVYRHDMDDNAEPFAFISNIESAITGVGDIPEITVYSENGVLVVEASVNCIIPATRLDGTVRELKLVEGYNYFELPKGFYIVAGKKVII